MEEKQELSLLQIGARLLLICVAAALLLTAVHLLTRDRIEAQRLAKIESSVQVLFSEADQVQETDASHTEADAIYTVFANGVKVGYGVLASGNGYGGTLQLMVGYTAQGEICGICVVSDSETQGIGSHVLSEDYLAQYEGKSGALSLEDVDGYSGATRSVKGVLAAVNAANAAMAEVLS